MVPTLAFHICYRPSDTSEVPARQGIRNGRFVFAGSTRSAPREVDIEDTELGHNEDGVDLASSPLRVPQRI